MFIRQLEYLVTLARERHFARAAEACCVSQPALSAAIRHLEEELGISIVERGQKFVGFTEDGEQILGWARQMLAAWDALKQEASLSRTKLTGALRIGAIPTTMPIVSLLIGPYWRAYPDLRQIIRSLSNQEIIRQIENYELDIGITYLEDQKLDRFRVLPLYRERYVLVARDAAGLKDMELHFLGGCSRVAAMPADAQHAEQTYHRRGVPACKRESLCGRRDGFGVRPILQCEMR